MAYAFYLDGVHLPVTPSKLQTKIKNQNKTITLINDGEINFIKSPGLTEIDFEVLIPQVKYPFATYKDGFKTASYFLEKFEQLKTDMKPFQFIVSRVSPRGKLLFDTNIKVSLEDYSITEDANNGLDLTISIKLKQYKDYGTKTVTIKPKTASIASVSKVMVATTVSIDPVRETTREIPKTYTVVSGDTLWAICKKYLNDGERYPEIASLNGISNPNLIYPGQVIKLE